MFPDIGIYLRGIRRELLASQQQAENAGELMCAMNYQRMSETLVQLIVEHEHGVEIATLILPRLTSLLREMVERMGNLGLQIPPAATEVLTDYFVDATRLSAAQTQHNFNRAVLECLAATSRQNSTPEIAAFGAWAGQEANRLEEDWRTARAEAAGLVRASSVNTSESLDDAPITDASLTECLRAELAEYADIRALNVRQQIGLNTKEIFFCEISDCSSWPTQVVLRRNSAADTVGNIVAEEFSLLEFLYNKGIKVPRPLLAQTDNPIIKRSFMISERVSGKALDFTTLSAKDVPAALEMARHLGQLHRLDAMTLPDSCRIYGKGERERTLAMVERFYRMTKASEFQPALTQEAAFAWLTANVGRIGTQTTVVHGDFDFRNILFDNQRLSAILDWELAHVGHPAEDLAYCRPQIERIMDWDTFLDTYYQCGGVEVSDEEIRYFEIYSDVFRLSTMYPATCHFLKGDSTNILMGTLGLIEFPALMSRLAGLLRRESER